MTDDDKNDRIRPLDEAAKQLYRDDPGFALQVERLGHLAGVAFVIICVIIGFLIKIAR